MSDKRTYADRAEYIKKAVTRRRKELRRRSIELLGGQCALCKYRACDKALEFHHRVQSTKSFGISEKGYTRSWKVVQTELQKCILLCANCHREVHAGITQLPVVTQE